MSTHYTPSKTSVIRLIRWKFVFIELIAPLLLVIATVSAFVDGVPYAYYVLGVTWAYIMLVIGWVHGGERALQAHAIVVCLWFTARSLVSVFTGTLDAPASTMLISGLVFGITAAMVQVHYRLDRLEAPSKSGHAAEFPGVYQITCRPNGMQYIGMTERAIKVRWEDHVAKLRSGSHHNTRLQNDWNIFRPEQFKWEVLEVVTDPVWLLDRERAWQNHNYNTTKRYNPPNLPPRIAKANRRPPMKRKART